MFLDGSSEVGAIPHCVCQSFKIAAFCKLAFSKSMEFFRQISGFLPDSYVTVGYKNVKQPVNIDCLKP